MNRQAEFSGRTFEFNHIFSAILQNPAPDPVFRSVRDKSQLVTRDQPYVYHMCVMTLLYMDGIVRKRSKRKGK